MAKFKYRAKENTGNTVEGVVEAETSEEAVEKINRLGYLPVKIEETATPHAPKPPATPLSFSFGSKIKSKDITAFSRQLSSLIKSGVPILRALAVIAEPAENPQFKNLLNKVHDEVKNGAGFSSALSRYPHIFPPLYLALVSAGETSGNLDQSLARITEYRQKQEEIVSRVRSALIYPILMALTGIGTIIFMLTYVMPRLAGVFTSLGGDLPTPTRILIETSHAIKQWGLLGGALLAVLFLVMLGSKKSKAQKLALGLFQLQTPVLGDLTMKSEIARFSRTLELLLRSGIPILKAIEATLPILSNEVLKNDLGSCLKDLREGGSFGRTLKGIKRFPVFMSNLIMIGEEAGNLEGALSEIAVFYERETDEAIRIFTSLLEPVMILVMGLVVGFIVIAMLLPVFELNLMTR